MGVERLGFSCGSAGDMDSPSMNSELQSFLELDRYWFGAARLSMAFIAPARIGVSYSLPNVGFLRSSELETRPTSLQAVVP